MARNTIVGIHFLQVQYCITIPICIYILTGERKKPIVQNICMITYVILQNAKVFCCYPTLVLSKREREITWQQKMHGGPAKNK